MSSSNANHICIAEVERLVDKIEDYVNILIGNAGIVDCCSESYRKDLVEQIKIMFEVER